MDFTKEQKAVYELAMKAAVITVMDGAEKERGIKSILLRIVLLVWVLPVCVVGVTYAVTLSGSWLIAVPALLIYVGWVSAPLSCMLALSVAGEVRVKLMADMIYADFQREQAAAKE